MQRKNNMPEIVYWGLFGINSKAVAQMYLWIAFLLGLASIYLGLSNPIYFLGCSMFAACWWYFHSINWVEKYSYWD